MRLRRCAVLWLEPRELAHFELGALLTGGTGVVSRMQWFAHAPTLDAPLEVEPRDVALLGSLSPHDWVEAMPLRRDHGAGRLRRLLRAGLLVGRGKAWAAQRERDEALRAQHWHPAAALYHSASRWQGMDSVRELLEEGMASSADMREKLGVPPPVQDERGDASARIGLPRAARAPLDELLDARNTCRNFDLDSQLPLARFAQVLERVFGARGQVQAARDLDMLKKTSPSGGALHPVDACLLVQRVEGLASGVYRYRSVDHALQPLPWPGGEETLQELAIRAVAGQHWFADAHVLVVLVPRFLRNFWKYRNHAKAYRVCILDAGHLSQTLFLSATEQGLGAFITAAINEVDIENAFGLTGYVDGPLAVCGFGIRADTMTTSELDPNHKVWKIPADAG
ncbi:MAG: putative peptide maturation dehydrogenase [Pseudomonadota bacterium]|nr:putative peptide maturation dehydrogenase [Pseudomonadota bacterium]